MAIENPCELAVDVQVLHEEARAELRELIAWGASAPDPEDVADDVVTYMRWLERRPEAATRKAALDALAQAAQDDGQYDPPKEPT